MHKLPSSCAAALAMIGLLAACGERTPDPASSGATPADPATQPAVAATANPHPVPTAAHAAVDLSGIARAENGQTVAELYAGKAELSGKPIAVRGRVVKVNEAVMGKTWVHLRDGTGAEGQNDLTVTTTGPAPAVGATALVTGTLSTDKDLGMGYRYEVIVEDAKLVVE